MTLVNCELKDCEYNKKEICQRISMTIQISDPSNNDHECYDYMPTN